MTKSKGYDDLVSRMGPCTTSQTSDLLEAARAVGDGQLLVAACMMICSIPQDRLPNAASYLQPLDLLCTCTNPAAGKAMLHMALHAQNARVRVEAIRRLGCVDSKAGRELLHRMAKEGFQAAPAFPHDVVQPEMVRIAAFESLRKLRTPSPTDGEAVLAAILKDLGEGEDSDAFKAGTVALAHLARASQLKDIVDAATSCQHRLMSLRLLAACSELQADALVREKERMQACLLKNLQDFREEGELPKRLCDLTKRITSKEFVLKLSERYHTDCLDRERGKVIASALGAYSARDEVLTQAYLRFAQTPDNVQQSSKCIAGLTSCAAAGNTSIIARRIVHQESAGYQQLVRSDHLRTVFASIDEVVNSLCDALDEIDDGRQRAAAATGCCEGLVWSSLMSHKSVRFHQKLEDIRRPGPRRGGGNPIGAVAEQLSGLQRNDDALAALAERLCSDRQSPGAVGIAEVLLGPYDNLAAVFLDRLVRSTLDLKLDCISDGTKEVPLAQVEESMFAECGEWFKDELPRRVVHDARLNRYAIDLMRRRDLAFVENADKALQQVETPDDAIFILRLLAAKADAKSLRLLGRAVEKVFKIGKGSDEVRLAALELLSTVAGQHPTVIDATLSKDLLAIIHNRFRTDTKPIRLCAYKTCGQFANPASIVPLRERSKSEPDPAVKRAIEAALTAIRGTLLESKPPDQAPPDMIVTWLGHVGDLGDTTMASEARTFLRPPYPEAVLKAALVCLGKSGDRDMIEVIDQFNNETAPPPEVLRDVRLAKATLQGRKDLSFVQVLSAIFDPEPDVLDPAIHYDKLFGVGRLSVMTGILADALKQWEDRDWDDFVEGLDGVCDLLNQDIFENRRERLGLTKEKAEGYLKKPYGGRLNMDELKNTLPTVQALFVMIHSLRELAKGPHPLKRDGAPRPGISDSQASLVMAQFKELFATYVRWAAAGGDSE